MATSMKYFLRALKGNSGSEQELRPSPHQPERCDVVESIEDGKPKLPPFQGDKVLDPHRSLVEKRRNQSVATESCPQEPPQHTERRPSHPTDAPPVPRLDTPESESDDQSDEHHPSPNPLETASKAMAASVPQKSSRDVPPQGASPADRSTPSESFKIKGLDDDMFQTVVNHRNGQQNASNSNSTRTRHRYSSSSAKKSEIDHSRYLKIKKQLDKCDRYCAELEHDNDALKDKNKALSQKYQTLRHDYQQLEEQVRVLQARNDSLEVAHIKSVNSVGTGIQPVSDQEFIKRLGELQSEVNSFSRRMSRHKEIKCDPLEIFPWLNRGSRYNGSLSECGLKVGTILEMVFWAALEQSHNDRVAIPDYGNHIEYFRQLEGWIRRILPSKKIEPSSGEATQCPY
ncbi:hypothetical protein EX30DRAFT_248856 [Ascodesmis nigricans]|uniref:Uncharacterized protein n=1 Tax=Ascodesmis nigricans TaxID=341454 RepID=A0A4S2MY67_9PEZI|nr:hypothetical protein EX30DRAFT_248856 [Ascodesmis nigricans]